MDESKQVELLLRYIPKPLHMNIFSQTFWRRPQDFRHQIPITITIDQILYPVAAGMIRENNT